MVIENEDTSDFEEEYFSLRQKEYRIYTDEEVALLPETLQTNPYAGEWIIRKQSSQRLINYLSKKTRPLKILEVGCGNGWLSHKLSKLTASKVIGIDPNLVELEQATRVFNHQKNLKFIYGEFPHAIAANEKFDIVVFAASIQYFPSLKKIITETLSKLNDWGEIHIIDSFFYREDEVAKAKQRSKEYFSRLGSGKMSNHYFHHCINDLDEFNHTLFYDPNNPVRKFIRKKNPFHWICIKTDE